MGKLSDEFSDELKESDQEGRFEATQVLDTGEAPHSSTLISLAFLDKVKAARLGVVARATSQRITLLLAL